MIWALGRAFRYNLFVSCLTKRIFTAIPSAKKELKETPKVFKTFGVWEKANKRVINSANKKQP